MKVRYWTYDLPFAFPFTISRGTKTHQPTFIVELEHFGLRGYGEAPAIAYYHIPIEKMVSDLENKKAFVEKYAFTEPERYWHYLHHVFPANNFLVCALDMAAWDLYGKMKKQPLYRLWDYDLTKSVPTDYTIGIDSAENMVKKVQAKPWPIYKVKLGTRDDLHLLKAIRDNTNSSIRVDANAGWTVEEAMQIIPELKKLGVELVEQPLPKEDWAGMKTLFDNTDMPLIADEACVNEQDVVKCHGHFHGINIKLTKCGGITPALRMIKEARIIGLKLMLGCMNESTIGTAALAHMAPSIDYLDADGPLLLDSDIASGITYEGGKLLVSGEPGLGIQFYHAV